MVLCIDIGNSVINFALFRQASLILQFSYNSTESTSSDQLGIFMKSVIIANQLDWQDVEHVVICSVVPAFEYSIRAAITRYFSLEPTFLDPTTITSINIKYNNPAEIGADRIATAIGAVSLYPQTNLIIIDMGTATTVCAVTKEKNYLGGAIIPGLKTSAKALHSSTAKLSTVPVIKPSSGLGKTTKDNIQIGLFYGHLGAIKELTNYLSRQAFNQDNFKIIGTGGLVELYSEEVFFDIILPELTLYGLSRFFFDNIK